MTPSDRKKIADTLRAVADALVPGSAVSARKRRRVTKSQRKKMERAAKRKKAKEGDKIYLRVNQQPKKMRSGNWVATVAFTRRRTKKTESTGEKREYTEMVNVGTDKAKLKIKGRDLQVTYLEGPRKGKPFLWGKTEQEKQKAKEDKEKADEKEEAAEKAKEAAKKRSEEKAKEEEPKEEKGGGGSGEKPPEEAPKKSVTEKAVDKLLQDLKDGKVGSQKKAKKIIDHLEKKAKNNPALEKVATKLKEKLDESKKRSGGRQEKYEEWRQRIMQQLQEEQGIKVEDLPKKSQDKLWEYLLKNTKKGDDFSKQQGL